jgi:teichuronic acid biosynthesis glycosyltransferase TuaC
MKILIFSEEYIKITKGMFEVWMNHARESSKRRHVDILLNQEHWAFNEARTLFKANKKVAVQHLPFKMPSTYLQKMFVSCEKTWVLRVAELILGQTINLVFFPLIIIYLSVRLYKLKPNAIFSHNGGWPAGQLCRWIIVAAMIARVPKRIFIIHSYPGKLPRFTGRLLMPMRYVQARLIDFCSTSIITVSDAVKDTLQSEVFKRPVLRIHNGIPLSPSIGKPQSYSPPLEWNPIGLSVGFVGALYPHKGPHVLLDAFRLIEVSCELALLGPIEPNYLKPLKKKSELCPNKVFFLGFHQDVDAFMEKIDLLVVPSIAQESFGMVILEAMKHSKPVICSDFGGMKEVVEDGVTGLVVPAGDEQALAQAITKLLANKEMRRQMGAAGYQRLKKLFTSEKMVAKIIG